MQAASLLAEKTFQHLCKKLLQAIGGCAGMVVSRAMISDLLDERESDRFFSLMMVISGIGPIVAPILGGYLISFFGWVFGLNAVGITGAAQANRVLLKRFSTRRLLVAGLLVLLIFVLPLCLFAAQFSLPLLVLFIWLCLSPIPVIAANSTALAMNACGKERVSGSSIIGVPQFGLASMASASVGLVHDGTIFPMAGIILACGLLGILIYLLDRFILHDRELHAESGL